MVIRVALKHILVQVITLVFPESFKQFFLVVTSSDHPAHYDNLMPYRNLQL